MVISNSSNYCFYELSTMFIIPQNLSAQIVCPGPKIWDFDVKRLHWESVIRDWNYSKVALKQKMLKNFQISKHISHIQRYTYRVLQTTQMKLTISCVWAEQAILGSAQIALKFKYDVWIGNHIYNLIYVAGYKLEKWTK